MSKLKRAKNKKWEDLFHFHLKTKGLDKHFQREYRFHHTRLWRFDFADPINKIAVEIQGGTWAPGKQGHNWGAGILKDHEKYNAAQFDGWVVFQFTDKPIKSLEAIDLVSSYYHHKIDKKE